MRVLIIQTSPFGDIVDTLPALTDAMGAYPNIVFDWVVENDYQEIPTWHPAVGRVIPTAMRRWRKHFWQTLHSPEWRQFKTQLRKDHYDLVIDCQSLIKSAVIGRLVKAPVIGLNKRCAREKAAAWLYQRQLSVNPTQPRIQRIRSLFSQALNYKLPQTDPDFGLSRAQFSGGVEESANIVFIHSASRLEKLYPEEQWQALIDKLSNVGIRIRLPWGSAIEKARAERLADGHPGVEILPKLNLQGLACVLVQASAVVSVDTGLGHLSAALGVPTVSLYNFPHAGDSIERGKNAIRLYPNQPCDNKEQDQSSAITVDAIAAQIFPFLPALSNRCQAG